MAAEGSRIDFMFLGPPYPTAGSATAYGKLCKVTLRFLSSVQWVTAMYKEVPLVSVISERYQVHCITKYGILLKDFQRK